MKKYFIYFLIDRIDGRIYVGKSSAKSPDKRWQNGWGYKTKGSKGIGAIGEAINKHGWDNFDKVVRATDLTKDEATKMERYYISILRTTDPRFGLNIRSEKYNHSDLYNDYQRKHQTERYNSDEAYRKKRSKYFNNWAEKFKQEHGCTYQTWKKHHPKNDK